MLSEQVDIWERELRDEGLQRGLHQLLGRLMQKRFGELPEPARARLNSASLEELEAWAEGFLDANSVAEVFGCVPPIQADS